MKTDEWEDRLKLKRKEKNRFFRAHPQSPIPFEEREGFKGLGYFPPDADYRFELELHEHETKEKVTMPDTSGNMQEFIRWGEFKFRINGQECCLQAYKSDPQEERLFIPFQDKTSGDQTYQSGRYIDLELEKDRTSQGKWILDFNQAYNPFCAYSDAYVCPLVPPENRLEVAVRAGEKNYSTKNR